MGGSHPGDSGIFNSTAGKVDEFLDFGGGDISEENFLQKTRDFHANATWRHVLRIDELAIETCELGSHITWVGA